MGYLRPILVIDTVILKMPSVLKSVGLNEESEKGKRAERKWFEDKDKKKEVDVHGDGLCAIAEIWILFYIFNSLIYLVLFCA